MSVVKISGIASRLFPAPFWKMESPRQTVRLSAPFAIVTVSLHFRSFEKTSPSTAWKSKILVNKSLSAKTSLRVSPSFSKAALLGANTVHDPSLKASASPASVTAVQRVEKSSVLQAIFAANHNIRLGYKSPTWVRNEFIIKHIPIEEH